MAAGEGEGGAGAGGGAGSGPGRERPREGAGPRPLAAAAGQGPAVPGGEGGREGRRRAGFPPQAGSAQLPRCFSDPYAAHPSAHPSLPPPGVRSASFALVCEAEVEEEASERHRSSRASGVSVLRCGFPLRARSEGSPGGPVARPGAAHSGSGLPQNRRSRAWLPWLGNTAAGER